MSRQPYPQGRPRMPRLMTALLHKGAALNPFGRANAIKRARRAARARKEAMR